MKQLLYILFSFIFLNSCSLPKSFPEIDQKSSPDYSLAKNWSALPFKEDTADKIPKYENWIDDSLKQVDVFYVYPTLYFGNKWNTAIDNKSLNRRIDKLPVKLQATAFNQVGRVYAPRYRQAHFKAFPEVTGIGQQSLELAYEDVKKAFEYYLKHYNKGRPIILAGHSQGSRHLRELLKDFFDTAEKKKQLVCAYIPGFYVNEYAFKDLLPCENPNETNCYVTWSSYKEGYKPGSGIDLSWFVIGNVCVNPISWTRSDQDFEGKGATLLRLNRRRLFKVKARIKNNYLSIETNAPIFKNSNEMHTLDYNLFWHDIRENVAARVNYYLNIQKGTQMSND